MWWTFDSKQSLIILCLGKYLSESIETLKVKTTRHYAEDIFKKLVVIVMMLVPGPFNGYHEIGITQQSLVRINWNFGSKRQNRFSHTSLKILVLWLIFSVPDPLL